MTDGIEISDRMEPASRGEGWCFAGAEFSSVAVGILVGRSLGLLDCHNVVSLATIIGLALLVIGAIVGEYRKTQVPLVVGAYAFALVFVVPELLRELGFFSEAHMYGQIFALLPLVIGMAWTIRRRHLATAAGLWLLQTVTIAILIYNVHHYSTSALGYFEQRVH